MSGHDAVWQACRRQLVDAAYNAPHSQPPVNLCGALEGTRVEVFGEELGTYGFIHANKVYDQARKASNEALFLLNHTLNGSA